MICSDLVEHRRRVEQRVVDVPGLVAPTWTSVLQHDYAPWSVAPLVIDTARMDADQAALHVLAAVQSLQRRVGRATG